MLHTHGTALPQWARPGVIAVQEPSAGIAEEIWSHVTESGTLGHDRCGLSLSCTGTWVNLNASVWSILPGLWSPVSLVLIRGCGGVQIDCARGKCDSSESVCDEILNKAQHCQQWQAQWIWKRGCTVVLDWIAHWDWRGSLYWNLPRVKHYARSLRFVFVGLKKTLMNFKRFD